MRLTGLVRRHLAATLMIALPLLAACGSDDSSDGGIDLSNAIPAEFIAHGSVEQLYVTDAEPGTELELVTAPGFVQQSGIADDNGTLIFRNVTAEDGYVVITREDEEIYASNATDVTTADDAPPQSVYAEQEIGPGYGYVRTRDGTLLAINVILPGAPEDGPYPTVVEYSGYDPANPDAPQPSTLISTALGYAAVGVNMRGTGCSGGAFQFFETLQSTDGYDVIETIAAQPWVKGGKVGMVGISYPGISQLFVAQLQPPHLAAITPLSVIADIGTGILYPGGMLNNGFAVSWAQDRQHDAQPGGQAWSQRRMDEGDQVCIDNQNLRGQTPDILQMIEDNPYYHPEIADPVSPATFVHRINVPVFLGGAWQDEQTGGYFPTMLDKFTGTDKTHFTMVNGNHTEALSPAIFARWMEFLDLYVAERVPRRSPLAPVIVQVIGDSALGTGNLPLPPERFTDVTSYEDALARFEADPRVRILFDEGAGGEPGYAIPAFELTFDEWPIPEVEPTAWYFGPDAHLSSTPPSEAGVDSYIYDPSISQRTSLTEGNIWGTLPPFNWESPEPGKAVAYATDPLEQDLVMAGSGSVDLWLQSTANDVDIQVTLSEVRPDGKETYVQAGWLRASHRKLNVRASSELRPVHTHREEDAAPLPAGEFAPLRVEIYPFAHAFRAGSRIRLIVGAPGGSRPLWRFEALPAEGEVTNSIRRAAATASRVVLPVLPGVAAEAPLPPCPSLRGQPCRSYESWNNTSS